MSDPMQEIAISSDAKFSVLNQYCYLAPMLILRLKKLDLLTDEEVYFLLNIRRKYPMLTEKQDRWAADLAQRIMAFQVMGMVK